MWFQHLDNLPNITIPRCLYSTDELVAIQRVSLHTFVDASQDAHAAVVYSRVVFDNGQKSSRIIVSKTRVAPLKSNSIPRLEMMAAVLGLRITAAVAVALKMEMKLVTFWSDSMNVLSWIRSQSRNLKPFVANRVGEIQTSTDPKQWRYIPSKMNPADLASRGVLVHQLYDDDTWLTGSDFLTKEESEWPPHRLGKGNSINDETRKCRSTVSAKNVDSDITLMTTQNMEENRLNPLRYSSWVRLVRVTAWLVHFIDNCRAHQSDRKTGELNPAEILDAEVQIIRNAQREAFRDKYVCLLRGKEIIRTSKLLPLHPRIDEDGFIRCDRRLTNAGYLSYDVRFSILLPRKHPVTKLIVKDFHEKLNHNGGTNQVFAAVSSRYWILSEREKIRDWERQCAACRFRKSKVMTQIMAPLPRSRLQLPLRAFVRVAVDYGGPLITIQGQGKRREKRYLCLFTCLLSRAVHLELAFGLDTDSFLNAFYRMVNRRGLPLEIISDNGTNFVGANIELCELVGKLDTEKLQACTANKAIKWHFNPLLAPHFGGVHETMIKSAKRAIYAILGNAYVTDKELMTVFTDAESLVNSRPLTYQSANPNDDVPLTPNHFLCGQVGRQFAPDSVDYSDFRPQKRWRRIQELVKHFCQRWMREWLPGLNARKKWFHSERDIRIGDVVLVVSPDSARGQWPLGRILEVHPGKDGHVRVVKVQVGKNVFVRLIWKLCIIETSDSTSIMDSQ